MRSAIVTDFAQARLSETAGRAEWGRKGLSTLAELALVFSERILLKMG